MCFSMCNASFLPLRELAYTNFCVSFVLFSVSCSHPASVRICTYGIVLFYAKYFLPLTVKCFLFHRCANNMCVFFIFHEEYFISHRCTRSHMLFLFSMCSASFPVGVQTHIFFHCFEKTHSNVPTDKTRCSQSDKRRKQLTIRLINVSPLPMFFFGTPVDGVFSYSVFASIATSNAIPLISTTGVNKLSGNLLPVTLVSQVS